ncbi:hypothetical protein FDA94_29190 [Herbidospora galbida]|uniref:Uncharacterized protein n=1 Tax=Herbidospora galbida TaxID=2575442 RepID=A0A4U3M793_9ACTN|nr:hypothetical protein [Herbidospora galbida]TKK84691.1 hypothetical protein FDA94_29190 [Herbidospora galbida]
MTKLREGSHWGIVMSTNDPEQRDRLKIRIPRMMGEEVTDWVEPDSLAVSVFKVGDRVWVRCLDGDTRHMVYHVPWDKKRAHLRNATDFVDLTHPVGPVTVRAENDTAYMSGNTSSVVMSGGKVHCMGKDASGYVPCVATVHEIASSVSLKHDIRDHDFDPFQVIKNAPVKVWKYVPEYSADQRDHMGPLLEQLPEEFRSGDNLDPQALVSVLWEAVHDLSIRVELLENRLYGPKSTNTE